MTDAERWRTVARWFEEAAATGDFSERRVSHGLCWALDKIDDVFSGYFSRAHVALYRTMGKRAYLSSDDSHQTRDGAGWRATLALLMAHMAEDDGGNHRNEDAT